MPGSLSSATRQAYVCAPEELSSTARGPWRMLRMLRMLQSIAHSSCFNDGRDGHGHTIARIEEFIVRVSPTGEAGFLIRVGQSPPRKHGSDDLCSAADSTRRGGSEGNGEAAARPTAHGRVLAAVRGARWCRRTGVGGAVRRRHKPLVRSCWSRLDKD